MRIFFLSILFGLLLFPSTLFGQIIPFGGPIITFNPICQTPPGIWITLGLPSVGSYMYLPNTISYAAGPPTHPGQFLLGLAGPYVPCIIWVPCPPAVCPVTIGGGLSILFHGSSI